MTTQRWLACGLVSLCVFLASCGGGNDSGLPAPGPTALPATIDISAAATAEVDAATAFATSLAASTRGIAFAWKFGDGATSTEAAPTHAYAAGGSYEVTLTVTNEAGATRTASFTVVASNTAMLQGTVCSGAQNTGWCWQRPKPIGGAIADVFFIDASNGWAVGDAGQILKTSDGGATWAGQRSGVSTRLTQVRFATATTGWAVGDAATVLRTVDGGATWVPQASGVPGTYYSNPGATLRLLSATKAIATLGGYTTRTTTDGGEHWDASQVTPSVITPDGTMWSNSGYSLTRSDDLGRTSSNVALPANGYYTNLQALDFTDDANGWALGYDNSAYPAALTLWRTTDHGANWAGTTPTGLPEYIGVNFMKIGANGKGWLGTYGQLYRTEDSGSSWTAVALPTNDPYYYYTAYAQALDGDTLGLPYANGVYLTRDHGASWTLLKVDAELYYSNSPRLQITTAALWLHFDQRAYRSTDNGATWQRVFGADAEDNNGSLQSMWFFDGKKGLAYSSAGWVVETADSGRTWTRKTLTNNYGGYNRARMQFVSATTGWLSVGNTISKTTDGGASWWSPLTTPDIGYPTDFHFIDASHGWVIGYSGAISSTSDGAQTWALQTTLPYSLRAIRFATASTGVVVGDGGIVARSTDGGATWSLRASGVIAGLTRVNFTDATTGWALGELGTVIKTTDAGATWTRVAVPSFATLNDVFFLDARRGWIVGSGGTVLATTDGGATWQPQASGTDKWLNTAFFTDSRTGWVMGDGGSILATASGGN